jgi:pimeloyl-ACP methyl ester carboxylesterase
MGGAVAVEAAAQLDRSCSLLIGVDTFTDAAFYQRRPSNEIERRTLPFLEDYPGSVARMVRQITAAATSRDVVEWIVGSMCRTDPIVTIPVLEHLLAWEIRECWDRLRCPAATINSSLLSRQTAGLA